MSKLVLNETPVRTSKNFNINNIKLEDISIPENILEFKNVDIINNSSNITIDLNTSNNKLTYGIGEFFEKQVMENSNYSANIKTKECDGKELQMVFKLDSDNKDLVENIEITAEENTITTVIIKYETEDDKCYYHNGIIRTKTNENAKLNVIVLNTTNESSNNFLSIENDLDDNSEVHFYIVEMGGKNSITNYYSNIKGVCANNQLSTIYLGKSNQTYDLNYIAELRGEKSNVDIEVEGALKDNARKHFKGTIDFKKGCKKATGNENENCMLLSDKAKSLALPMLLCSEEDVEGNHSSSAGKVGEKELFYIMSRGFSLQEAQKLMVRAKFNKILEKITNMEIKNRILYEIDRRLD